MPGLDVDHVIEVLDRLEEHPIAVTLELCTRKRHRLSTCTRCFDVCPVGAITWDDGLQIDWEVCTGCGLCAAVCPTGALEAKKPTNDELIVEIQRVLRGQDEVVFACPRVSTEGRAQPIRVGCVGRLDESLLVSAVAYGAKAVWLVDGACESCPQAGGRALTEKSAARANALLEAFGRSERVAFREDLPEGEGSQGASSGVSRRGLFKVLARETARVGEIAATVEKSDTAATPTVAVKGELPRALPSKRVLLLAALQRLGEPCQEILVCDPDGPFAQFQLGEGCTGCQMCAFFCPTGALTKVVEDGRMGLAFRLSHCVNCHLCHDVCYQHAVEQTYEVDLRKVVGLSVEWMFAQEMDAEPWKKPLSNEVAKRILEEMSRQTQE